MFRAVLCLRQSIARPLIADALVRSQVSPYDLELGKVALGQIFL
jgi:hypothetical protein